MLNPLHVQTVREVVRTGSFADAARNLGYTASAVSQQVAALERAAGITLFERLARSVRPTNAAYLVADKGGGMLSAMETLERELRALASGDKGLIRVGSFPTASARILPPALAGLVRDRPGIEISLNEGEPDETLSLLVDGDLDILLVYGYDYFPRSWPEQLVQTPLMDEDLLLLVSRSHPLAGSESAGLDDLRAQTWIVSRPETAGARAFMRMCESAGFTPNVAFRSNDYAVVCALVRSGLGIALVPALGYNAHEDLRVLSLEGPRPRRHVVALHRESNHNPLLCELLSELKAAAHGAAHRDARSPRSG